MNRRAFTYIEVSVVLILLVLAAAMVSPSFAQMKRAQAQSDFRNGLPGMVSRARETAIARGQAVDLQFDENSRQMQIVPMDAQDGGENGQIRNASGLSLPTDSGTAPLFIADLPTGVEAASFQTPPETTAGAAWSVRFYPDGTAAPAGIEFNVNDESYSLVVEANGLGRVVTGGIPDLTASKWQAGDYVHRTP